MVNSILIAALSIALIAQSWAFNRYMKRNNHIIDQICEKLAKINLDQSKMQINIEDQINLNNMNWNLYWDSRNDLDAIKYLLSRLKIQSFGKRVGHDRTFGDALHRIGVTQVKKKVRRHDG